MFEERRKLKAAAPPTGGFMMGAEELASRLAQLAPRTVAEFGVASTTFPAEGTTYGASFGARPPPEPSPAAGTEEEQLATARAAVGVQFRRRQSEFAGHDGKPMSGRG